MDSLIGAPTRSAWRALVTAVLTTAVVLALAGTGYAHLRSHSDPDDTGAPLDIRTASLDRSDGQLVAKITTHDRLRARHFQGGEAFLIKLDTRGGPRSDFTLRLDYYEGAYPYCALYDRDGFSRAGGTAQKGRRSFTCTLPFSALDTARHIRWRVVATAGANPDMAPNRGWYEH